MKSQKIQVGVVGARGYSGTELCRFLLKHPDVELKYLFANSGDISLTQLGLKSHLNYETSVINMAEIHNKYSQMDVLFLATPHEVSIEIICQIQNFTANSKLKVIDLSGAFRLHSSDLSKIKNDYQVWYKMEHKQVGLLSSFKYGIVPFANEKEKSKNWISNPGCYVTSALMALIPLLKAGLVISENIVIDAKSGTSGAGKKASENLLFSEVFGECIPYKTLTHQHTPEIKLYLENYSNKNVNLVFSPHLLPVHRGIISSIYLAWTTEVQSLSKDEKIKKVNEAYQNEYKNYPLVQWGHGEANKNLLNLKNVVGTPMTNINYQVGDNNLVVFSLIDNLLKGAATQAIENMNILFELKPEHGLI